MKIVNQHFINGRFVDSHGQETVDIHNPATGELIGRSGSSTNSSSTRGRDTRSWSAITRSTCPGVLARGSAGGLVTLHSYSRHPE
jgi:hypothetical protein